MISRGVGKHIRSKPRLRGYERCEIFLASHLRGLMPNRKRVSRVRLTPMSYSSSVTAKVERQITRYLHLSKNNIAFLRAFFS